MSPDALRLEILEQKSKLRQHLLHKRSSLTLSARAARDVLICQHLNTFMPLQISQNIAAYRAFRGEVELQAFLKNVRQTLYPRCEGKHLVFCSAQVGKDDWVVGRFGILEPHSVPVDPDQIDWVLLPALSCDLWGFRVGYGGGFYDRFLSANPALQSKTIAVLSDEPAKDPSPRDPWDVPVAFVVSPKRGVQARIHSAI